jgi:hypothetical protein
MAEPHRTLLLFRILVLALVCALALHLARGGDFPSRQMEIADVE